VSSAKKSSGQSNLGPELFFAIIAPVGTPKQKFIEALETNLADVGYTPVPIKLSQILTERAVEDIQDAHEEKRVDALMNAGNQACEDAQDAAAVAFHGVLEIREHRVHQAPADATVDEREKYRGRPVPRTAYIIDSLKRPTEVIQLRELWGDSLVVVSLRANREHRRKELKQKIEKQNVSVPKKQIEAHVDHLIERDEREEGHAFGQNVLRTFPLADWFVDVSGEMAHDVRRFVHIFFGDSASEPATTEEFAMQAASQAAMLSPELGNRVGAVLVDEWGSVVASGANVHPVDTEQPRYDESFFSIKGLVADTLIRLKQADLLSDVAASHTTDDEIDHYVTQLLLGDLKDAKIRDITEFQLPVHAEMNLILSALRSGISVNKCSLFVTAHPCHFCAKHLIPLGLKVVYLEPYPKSRAAAMYGDVVLENFQPFTGIAPRRFESIFHVSEDRKTPEGQVKTWEKKFALPKVDPFVAPGINNREVSALQSLSSDSATDKQGD
jgi:deoxycytidylate deaminase